MKRLLRGPALAWLSVLLLGGWAAAYTPGQRWTADRLLERSDALVFGSVDGVEAAETRGRPYTAYRFGVWELHLDRTGGLAPGREIRVCAPGGAYTDPSGKQRTWGPAGAPELETGATYVLFLRRQPARGCYRTVGGEAGVFLVDEAARVLDAAGNAILGVEAGRFVATPGPGRRAARGRKPGAAPPAGVVEDLTGTRRAVRARSGSAFDQGYDDARVLRKDAFLLQVLGGRP
ncbi:MAG: hypothetical protein Kow0092_26650 [Deferrisomatales bacterium]